MTSQAQKELQTCQRMCEELKEKIGNLKRGTSQQLLTDMAGNVEAKSSGPKSRKTCTGHFGKIYALHWGSDSRHIVTASQDGKLIVWNALTGNKQLAITLNSAWVMTCAFSASFDYVASGGLDNTVSIFRTTQKDTNGPGSGKFKAKDLYKELEKHDGYLSCARFVNGKEFEIVSSSGDGTCILWDIENRTPKSVFADHTGDVMCVALNKKHPDLFVSGSVDTTAKVWDMRQGERCTVNFAAHEADVNTVQWFADSNCVVTGSDDGSVRLFDMRSYRQINNYSDKNCKSLHSDSPAGVTSVDVSKTGQYIFSAYDNGHVYMWNTLKGVSLCDLEHDSRVSSLGISDDGYGLATGCWDFNLKIFA